MGKFENDIESKLGNFSLTPSEHVWEGVEAALHEKKKRRFAFWWWIPVAAILLLGAGWWVLDSGSKDAQQSKELTATTADNKKENITAGKEGQKDAVETAKAVEERTNHVKADNKENLVPQNTNSQSIALNRAAITRKAAHKKTTTKNAITIATVAGHVPANEATATSENVETSKAVIASTKQQKALQEETTTAKTVELTVDSLTKKDSTAATIAKNLLQQKDSTTSASIALLLKSKTKKQHQWLVTAGGGISLVRGNTLLSQKSYDNAAFTAGGQGGSNPSTGLGSASNGNSPSIALPNTGFFFSAGIAYETSIGKHWAGNIGLQYRYIQNRQVIYDTLLWTVERSHVTNTSHWLDLPVNIKYTMNPKKKIQYGLQVGGSVAWAFSQKWAYVPKAGYYYYDKALNNNIILGLNAGAFIKTNNGLTFTLMGEQSLTPIHKVSNYKYFWRQWSAQVSLPLNLLHKQKN